MNKTKRKYKGGWCLDDSGIKNAKILILDKKLYRIDELDDGIINALKGTKSCNNYPIFINLLRFIANYKGTFKNIYASLQKEEQKYESVTESNSFITYALSFASGRAKRDVNGEMTKVDFKNYQDKIKSILIKLGEPLTVVPIGKTRSSSVVPFKDPTSPRSDTSDETTSTTESTSSNRSTSTPGPSSTRRQTSSLEHSSNDPKINLAVFDVYGNQIESERSKKPFGTPKKKTTNPGQKVVPFEGGKSKRNNRSNNKTKRKYKK
jgi:hypothetical protein